MEYKFDYSKIRGLGFDFFPAHISGVEHVVTGYSGDNEIYEARDVVTPAGWNISEAGYAALESGGFASKFFELKLVSPTILYIKVQQPGQHKYDLMIAVYGRRPSGEWVLINVPEDMPVRQASSSRSGWGMILSDVALAAKLVAVCVTFYATAGAASGLIAGAGAGAGAAVGGVTVAGEGVAVAESASTGAAAASSSATELGSASMDWGFDAFDGVADGLGEAAEGFGDFAANFDSLNYSSGESLAAFSDAQNVGFGFDVTLTDVPIDSFGSGSDLGFFNSDGVTFGNTMEPATGNFGAIDYGADKFKDLAIDQAKKWATNQAVKAAIAPNTSPKPSTPTLFRKFDDGLRATTDAVRSVGALRAAVTSVAQGKTLAASSEVSRDRTHLGQNGPGFMDGFKGGSSTGLLMAGVALVGAFVFFKVAK